MEPNQNIQSNQVTANVQPISPTESTHTNLQVVAPPIISSLPVKKVLSKKYILILLTSIVLIIIAIFLIVDTAMIKIERINKKTTKNNQVNSQDENASQQPNLLSSQDYTLQRCANTNLSLLMPSNWFYKAETSGGTESCFMTKENIETNGFFETGIAVNRLINLSQKTSMSAYEYAEELINKLETSEGVIKATTIEKTASTFPTFSRYAETDKFKVYYLALVDEANDTVYVISFESPHDSWDQEFPKALEILSKISLVSN